MTEQEKQKLNEKLARWAGCEDGYITLMGIRYSYFTNSLDACFKWLVPKLDYFCLQREDAGRGFYADVSIGEQYAEYYQGETQPLALCLAVEKLIDEESK